MSVTHYQIGALDYLASDLVPQAFAHGFTTRMGGVSREHLASLNLGVHRGDDPENVRKNYEIFGNAVGFKPENTVLTHQVHSTKILTVTAADCGTGLLREQETECDGLITDEPNVALTVFGADCTTILLCDDRKRVACAVHSGWRGTANGMARIAVERMERDYGCDPAHITAVVGPCIGQCCFETDGDVPAAMTAALGQAADAFIAEKGVKYHVDLKGINGLWLRNAGVGTVDIAPDCTACRPDLYWSHRRVGNARGSLAAVIMRKP